MFIWSFNKSFSAEISHLFNYDLLHSIFYKSDGRSPLKSLPMGSLRARDARLATNQYNNSSTNILAYLYPLYKKIFYILKIFIND